MQEFTYTKEHNLLQLNDELLAAIPALAPVTDPVADPDSPNAKRAVFRCEGRQSDNLLRITIPDAVARSEVAAVVSAHVADPDYGVDPLVTEDDVTNMTDRELRAWLARRLL